MTAPQEPSPGQAWGPPPEWSGAATGTAHGHPAGPPRTDARAVVALVLAVGSFVVLPLVPAVAALVLAQRSRREIAASGGALTGEGLVTAARVVAWVNVVLSLLAVLAAVAALVLFAAVGTS